MDVMLVSCLVSLLLVSLSREAFLVRGLVLLLLPLMSLDLVRLGGGGGGGNRFALLLPAVVVVLAVDFVAIELELLNELLGSGHDVDFFGG